MPISNAGSAPVAQRWAIITAAPQEDAAGVELFRTNYFETFPIAFQHFTGFGQTEKVKIRVVITYGYAELG